MRTAPLALRAAAAAAVCALAGCGVSGLNFVTDDRIEIVVPEDRAAVGLPVEIRWRVHDFDVTGRDGADEPDAGYFGIYVDRAPQPPDRTQEWLFRDDPDCAGVEDCPDEAFLAQRNIHATTETSFTIDRLPLPSDDDRREIHEVTIVLLDGRGERIGESASTVTFEVRR